MKKEAREKALKLFLKSRGRMSNRDIARRVNVNALTVGRWKRNGNWDAELKKAVVIAPAEEKGVAVRKKEARDQALKLFMEAFGNITNKELAEEVEVSPATIGKWKEQDNWNEKLREPRRPFGPEKVRGELDWNELANPSQIIEINRKIDSLLKREHLSADEVADLAAAKSELLEGLVTYIAIVQELEGM